MHWQYKKMANGILKVEGHADLVRDVETNAIVRTSLRGVCSEINNLKKELREIKDLIKKVVK